MNDGRPRETAVYLRHAEGFRIPVKVPTSPMYNEKGEVIGDNDDHNWNKQSKSDHFGWCDVGP